MQQSQTTPSPCAPQARLTQAGGLVGGEDDSALLT